MDISIGPPYSNHRHSVSHTLCLKCLHSSAAPKKDVKPKNKAAAKAATSPKKVITKVGKAPKIAAPKVKIVKKDRGEKLFTSYPQSPRKISKVHP
jgi:hypothetical protein